MSNSFDLIYGTVSDRRDGTYIGLFTITNVGKYDLSALLGTQVIVQDIPVQIIAGLPSTPQVVLDNLVPARIIAGLDFPLSFQLRDEYSNLIQDCTDFAAFVYISNSGSVVSSKEGIVYWQVHSNWERHRNPQNVPTLGKVHIPSVLLLVDWVDIFEKAPFLSPKNRPPLPVTGWIFRGVKLSTAITLFPGPDFNRVTVTSETRRGASTVANLKSPATTE